jgi:hypothetical protein
VSTIESFIAMVTKRGGGRTQASTPSPSLAICGHRQHLAAE